MATDTSSRTDLLGIFMNDQLALGMGWRELARRSSKANADTPLGEALATVAEQIDEDIRTFQRIMERLGIVRNPVKGPLMIAGERVARLKLNGRLLSYSPLSRFVELDVLTIGIGGKTQLWATLRDLAGLGERLPDVDFDELIRRAEQQRDTLEPFRQQAGRHAFGTATGVSDRTAAGTSERGT